MATIAVEFLGCLADATTMRCQTGVKTLLDRVPAEDFVLIHTQLVSEDSELDFDEQRKAVEDWLKANCLRWDGIWTLTGKPQAAMFVETLEQLKQAVVLLERQKEVRDNAVSVEPSKT